MRKIWSRIFVLCMACMICMCGLCLAADDGNWVEYYRIDEKNLFCVNPSSINIHKWGGHKFLEVEIRDEQPEKAFKVDEVIAIDIENRKYIHLKVNKWKLQDISEIVNGEALYTKHDILVKWVEKNRPEVINEIREYNKNAPPLPTPKTDVTAPRGNTPIDPTPGIDRQPGTQAQPGGNVDVTGTPNVPSSTTPNVSGDLHSLIYTPVQSEKATLAFCPLDTDGDISEIYRNPYKRGAEYKIISTFPTSDGKRGYYHEFPSFNYIPDDPDDPGAGGDFLFVDYYGYYMRIRKIGETAVKISWLDATQSSPQLRRPDEMRPYPEDTYELQLVTQGKVKIKKVPYRFVSTHGIIIQECKEELGAVFAVLDFLNEGNTLNMIADPPQGMALPGEAEDFKDPGKYRKIGTGVEAAR